jgi:hypothetical protein
MVVSLPSNGLNYPVLLAMPDEQALISAISRTRYLDFQALLTRYTATLSPPSPVEGAVSNLTYVSLVTTDARQADSSDVIQYERLDLGDYMACCELYLTAANAVSPSTVAAWMMINHGLWFDPLLLTITAAVPDPSRLDRQLMTVSVNSSNYVWVGSVTLYVVPANHLGLLAKPGISTGIRLSDVGLSQSA